MGVTYVLLLVLKAYMAVRISKTTKAAIAHLLNAGPVGSSCIISAIFLYYTSLKTNPGVIKTTDSRRALRVIMLIIKRSEHG